MSVESITIIGLAITNVVTIVGWIISYKHQKDLIAKTQKYHISDRELSTFRVRIVQVDKISVALREMALRVCTIKDIVLSSDYDQSRFLKSFNSLLPYQKTITDVISGIEYRGVTSLLSKSDEESLAADYIKYCNNTAKFYEYVKGIHKVLSNNDEKSNFGIFCDDYFKDLTNYSMHITDLVVKLDKKLSS